MGLMSKMGGEGERGEERKKRGGGREEKREEGREGEERRGEKREKKRIFNFLSSLIFLLYQTGYDFSMPSFYFL